MTNEQFFNQEEARNKDKWACANGSSWGQSFKSSWGNADGDDENGGDDQTYVIQIVNSCTTAAISNVDFGQSAAQRFNGGDAANPYGNTFYISLSSTVPNVSYDEFLASTESEPFMVGSTMVISTSAGQLEQGMQITQKDAGGEIESIVLNQTLSPMQVLTDRLISFRNYPWNAATRFRFNQINASATVTVRLSIKNKFSALQYIQGNNSALLDFSKPKLLGT